ncbi:MAG TPA: NUDIX domain-containing protein [Flavilitoribacter sp.]|nr:NUDIX domain-containing protein [Flavilitoribacter sp.]HMQ91104.1 NUDIX domain-containing protein [Flavilitoribacter sp.]
MNVEQFLERGADYFLPNLSVDLVIIGYADNELKCLLLKIGNKWLLPGGYIGKEESVVAAATRTLKDRTGLTDPHLKFLAVFGDNNRRFTDEWQDYLNKIGMAWSKDSWLNARFVSLAYYSLVDIRNTFPTVSNLDEDFRWFSFDELPAMWMDHRSIVLEARNRLKEDIKQEEITFKLLPEQFTMPELHQLHEAILETKLDRSRFQKKMLSTGIFERLPKRRQESPGSNPYQYSVKPQG